jgi:hypothetical protein
MTQTEEQDKFPETDPKDAEVYELTHEEFKITITKMMYNP